MSLNDLMTYAQFHLGDGTAANGTAVLSRVSLQLMQAPRVHKNATDEDMGLGWHLRRVGGVMTAAPYRVLAADHWAFAGTGLSDGDTFGEASLHERIPGGASGHETDKMSPSTPTGAEHLAKGLNPDEGGGDIVHFTTPSGGAVFSVGSITWPSSLLVDPAVSRITANVLKRFAQK